MKAVRVLSACALAVFSAHVLAEGFGIRFVVDDTSLRSAEDRDLLVRNLKHIVGDLNAIYTDSDVSLTAKIVDIGFSSMQNNDLAVILQEMQLKKGAFTDFVDKANRYGADFTVAVVPGLQSGAASSRRSICGAAHGSWNVQDMVSVEKAYAVIDPRCGSYSLAHELGHVMGLNHGVAMKRCFPDKKEGKPITPYAFGYSEGECDGKRSPEKFGDIMTGGVMKFINGDPRGLNIFSNPRIRRPECGARGICGDPETGDAARALNENAKHFIKYRPQGN